MIKDIDCMVRYADRERTRCWSDLFCAGQWDVRMHYVSCGVTAVGICSINQYRNRPGLRNTRKKWGNIHWPEDIDREFRTAPGEL